MPVSDTSTWTLFEKLMHFRREYSNFVELVTALRIGRLGAWPEEETSILDDL
jgi:hypothetical protein